MYRMGSDMTEFHTGMWESWDISAADFARTLAKLRGRERDARNLARHG